MNRREFITMLGGAAAAWPGGARFREGETAVIITFTAEASSRFQSEFRSFRFADWLT